MRCFIGLGSSLGDREALIKRGIEELQLLARPASLRVSRIFETPAVVPENAPPEWRVPYLNAVAEMEWDESALILLKSLKDIEHRLGRRPAPRWSPRPIDLDLLLYGEAQLVEATITVPHPEIWERSFVLDPLSELAPDLRIPGYALTVRQRAHALRGRRLRSELPAEVFR